MKQYIKLSIDVYKYEAADVLTYSKQTDNIVDDQEDFVSGGNANLFG